MIDPQDVKTIDEKVVADEYSSRSHYIRHTVHNALLNDT